MNAQSNVTPIADPAHILRRARGAYVKQLLDDDDRSMRYVASRIGISPTSMADRCKGKVPFLADELEEIASVLKMDAVKFYAEYISVGSGGFEPPTSSVESRGLAPVTPIRRGA